MEDRCENQILGVTRNASDTISAVFPGCAKLRVDWRGFLVRLFGFRSREPLFSSGKFLFHLLVQPVFELFL